MDSAMVVQHIHYIVPAASWAAKAARMVGRAGMKTARTMRTTKTSLFGEEEGLVGSDRVWVQIALALTIIVRVVAVTIVVVEVCRALVLVS
jgi:hypothetical protein